VGHRVEMMTTTGTLTSESHSRFVATRWSVVLAAKGRRDDGDSRRAMEELARVYWFALYAYVRRRGYSREEAEDLTQGFFARLLEKDYLADVDRSKGKFRSFLLASLKHFVANEWDKSTAQKRGGGGIIALDSMDAEARYAAEPVEAMTPEHLFERRWALAVLDQVLLRLQGEYSASGKAGLFAALRGWLSGDLGVAGYGEIAQRLGMTEGAVKVGGHRLRRRYREILKEEIAQTVVGPDEVEEEIAYLLSCLRTHR